MPGFGAPRRVAAPAADGGPGRGDPLLGDAAADAPPRARATTSFEDDLLALSTLTARMGGRAEEVAALALGAIERRDAAAIAAAEAAARDLAALERRLAAHATAVLALRSPVAADLRLLLASLRVAASLERTGALARNLASRAGALGGVGPEGPEAGVLRLGRRALGRLGEALSAHQAGDAARSLRLVRRDAELDELCASLMAALVRRMAEAPERVDRGAEWLMAAKTFERWGDHAAGVARATHFMVTGQEIEGEAGDG